MAIPSPTASPRALSSLSSSQTLLRALSPVQALRHNLTPLEPQLHTAPAPTASRDELPEDLVLKAKSLALMRRPKVLALTGWSKSTLANRVADNEFPSPVPTGPRTVAWVEAEVFAWIEARIVERDTRLEKQKAFGQNFQGTRGGQA